MDAWTARPDRETLTLTLPILRAQPGKNKIGVVLAHDIVGAYTHYWRNRTVLCTDPNCEPCNSQRKPRWYGYLPIWSPETNAKAILEFTSSALDAIDAYVATHDTLRGALISLSRANNKINSKIIATLKHSDIPAPRIPLEPPTRQLLERMWEVPPQPTPKPLTPQKDQTSQAGVAPKSNGRSAAKQN